MSQAAQQVPISQRVVVYKLPTTNAVTIRHDIGYRETDSGFLNMDAYYPPDFMSGTQIPAVVFVSGFPDSRIEPMFGCKLKDMGSYVSWAKLAAASGLVAVT